MADDDATERETIRGFAMAMIIVCALRSCARVSVLGVWTPT